MSTAVMPTTIYDFKDVLKTVKTDLLQHGGSLSQSDVSGKLSWEDLHGPMDNSPGQQELITHGSAGLGRSLSASINIHPHHHHNNHHHQNNNNNNHSSSSSSSSTTSSSSNNNNSNFQFTLASLLDNFVINQHRRLDRTQSEPSKSSNLNVVNTSRYKTELCRPFEESGTCKYGDKCQFAHGEHELRGLVRHPKYKTELCRTFHTVGFCPYGPRCHFIHNADEARGQVAKFRPRPLSLDTSPASSLGSVSPPPSNSPPPPPVSPDSRLPVFNRISAPNTPLFPYSVGFRELLA